MLIESFNSKDTDLSRDFVKNAPHIFSADASAEYLLSIMSKLSMDYNGTFFDYAGHEIKW